MNFVYVALGGALGAVKRGESYDPDRASCIIHSVG